ncbi:hypothetical protein J3458_022029 [Metarhizium acridum]|uniref:uncharacterized protein n=1 Tax=Metarhizium acridum TaxID=92637 RepID=UPI001C6C6559|nr:hypothetical protein J3458_022029 [Metarhizium acridum]
MQTNLGSHRIHPSLLATQSQRARGQMAEVLAWTNQLLRRYKYVRTEYCLGLLRSYRRHSSKEEKGKFMGHRHSTPSYQPLSRWSLVGSAFGWGEREVVGLGLRTCHAPVSWPGQDVIGKLLVLLLSLVN